MGDDLAVFRARARASVERLGCYRAGWVHSDRRLEREGAWPAERWPAALRLDLQFDEDNDDDLDETSDVAAADHAPTKHTEPDAEPDAVATFDAGDMGCGDLVLELRGRLAPLAPGDVLHVRATDPGAPGDLPAWCRVTHHTLVHHEHPHYWIKRRDDAAPSPS